MAVKETARRFDWLTVEEVVVLTGYSKPRIHQMIQAGLVPAKTLPRLTLIHRVDAEKLPKRAAAGR